MCIILIVVILCNYFSIFRAKLQLSGGDAAHVFSMAMKTVSCHFSTIQYFVYLFVLDIN